jgi:hypothetical protein
MKRFFEVVPTTLARVLLTAVLLAPIVIYIDKFGFTISNDHQRWSEMGSAMSGIYGPILAFLAFAVLILQVRMQSESNKHMLDQSHIQQADADIAFYLGKLESAMEKMDSSGRTAGQHLKAVFAFATIDQLREEAVIAAATLMNREHSQLFAAWAAYQSIIAGLAVVKEQPYLMSLSTAKQRAIVVLSFEMCAALDNFTWCVTNGRLNGPYVFSNLFASPSR